MQLTREGRRVWPHDGGPATNNDGRVDVCVSGMSAGDTEELRLSTTVSFVDAATNSTGARGIARVYSDYLDTCESRFVLNLGPEVSKGPRVDHSPLCLTNRYPRANMRQVFERNSAMGVIGTSNQSLADTVIQQSMSLCSRAHVVAVADLLRERDELQAQVARTREAAAKCKPAVHVRQGWVEVPEDAWREMMQAIEGEGGEA